MSLALGDGKLWVALRDADRVLLVNTQTLSRTRGAIVSVPVKVIVQHSSAWVLSLDAGALYPLNGSSGSAGEPIYAPVANPIDAASAGGEVWLLGARESGLSPVNAGLGRIVRSGFDMRGRVLTGLSSSGSTLWLAEPVRRALLRVRASTVAVSELPAPRGMRPVATAVGSCGVWVGGQHGMLALINPQTGAVLGPPLQAGRSIAALAPSGAGVWLSDPRDGTVRYVQPQPAA